MYTKLPRTLKHIKPYNARMKLKLEKCHVCRHQSDWSSVFVVLFCFDHLMVLIEVWINIYCFHQHCRSISAPKLIVILIHENSVTTYACTVYGLLGVVLGRFYTIADSSIFLQTSIEVSSITMHCLSLHLIKGYWIDVLQNLEQWSSIFLHWVFQNVLEDWILSFDMTLVISR